MREPKFLFLFLGLLGLLLGVPSVNALLGRPSVIVVAAGHSVLLLAGVWTLAHSWTLFRIGIVLAAGSIITTALAYAEPTLPLALASVSIAWAFCLLTTLLCLRYVVAPGRVTVNHLLGGTSIYLLLGVFWALTYRGLHLLRPDAFRVSGPAGPLHVDDFMYFSFITLTTTGYGDIVPADHLVRTIVYLESVAGQLFVAILVATLVSRYVAPADPPRS